MREFLTVGCEVHAHTDKGIQIGTAVAFNQFVVMFNSGREWPRRHVHLGRSC